MKTTFRHAAYAVLALFAFDGAGLAQFDTNGPNAELTLQGVVPSAVDPVGHDVTVLAPGIFDLRITTGVNPSMPWSRQPRTSSLISIKGWVTGSA